MEAAALPCGTPLLRRRELRAFQRSLACGRGARELEALAAGPAPGATARVLLLRHGMGRHNQLGGAFSVFNRDGRLNAAGRSQAELLHGALREARASDGLDLVVVSPFVRTLETAARALGSRAKTVPTVVQPLCAEHTLFRSALQQGDRGSTVEELRKRFPRQLYPQYDFSLVEAYCQERGLEDGRWWCHHSGEWRESRELFGQRCRELRRWLSEECARRGAERVLLVSHGGCLHEAFGWRPKPCQGLAVDLWVGGRFSLSLPPFDTSDDSLGVELEETEKYCPSISSCSTTGSSLPLDECDARPKHRRARSK